MKVITLTEPWASLVAAGVKQIETRSWRDAYRGPIAIHAGKKLTTQDIDFAMDSALCWEALDPALWSSRRWGTVPEPLRAKDAFLATRGKILAVTHLVAVVPTHRVSFVQGDWPTPDYEVMAHPSERSVGDFSVGRYAWVFGDVYRFEEAMPASGALGLWEWEPPAALADLPRSLVEFESASISVPAVLNR